MLMRFFDDFANFTVVNSRFFKVGTQMQTPPDCPKQPISLPEAQFENANHSLFTMANQALVNYHF